MSEAGEFTESGIVALPVSGRPQVSILIPSRSQPGLLEECLKSLGRHISTEVAYEVIIVLNSATDELKHFARNRIENLVVLESDANLGVAGGYNRARSAARGEYLLLLHDDCEIEPNWLESLLETLAENPAAGAVGSFQIYPDGRPQRVGSIIWQNAVTSPTWGTSTPDPLTFTEVRPVDFVGTCSCLVRAATWDAVGGMDEDIYPAYYVDVTLCMRIRRLGQTVLCNPKSRVRHHQASSSNKSFRHLIIRRNRARFAETWAAELADCEPHAPDDPEAIARADQRTARLAADLTSRWKGFPQPPSPPDFDAEEQERRHFRMELALFREYQKRLLANENRLTEQLEKSAADLAKAWETASLRQKKIGSLRERTEALESELKRFKRSPLKRLLAKLGLSKR